MFMKTLARVDSIFCFNVIGNSSKSMEIDLLRWHKSWQHFIFVNSKYCCGSTGIYKHIHTTKCKPIQSHDSLEIRCSNTFFTKLCKGLPSNRLYSFHYKLHNNVTRSKVFVKVILVGCSDAYIDGDTLFQPHPHLIHIHEQHFPAANSTLSLGFESLVLSLEADDCCLRREIKLFLVFTI